MTRTSTRNALTPGLPPRARAPRWRAAAARAPRVAHHEDGEQDDQELHQVVARHEAEYVLIQLRGRERKERRERHAGGRRGQSDEVALRATGLRDVEARQPDGRRHDVEVAENPLRLAGGRELELVDEKCGRGTEAH